MPEMGMDASTDASSFPTISYNVPPNPILPLDSDQPVRMCSCKRISVFAISFMRMTFTSANFFKCYRLHIYHIRLTVQLMAQFRIFPSSESRHSFVANYTSAVKFKIHILVLFCCIIILLYVSESKYL